MLNGARMAASGLDTAFVRMLTATRPNGSFDTPNSYMYRLAHAAYAGAPAIDSGTPAPICDAKERRKGSLAVLREFHGRRATDAHTSAVSQDPENTACMASAMANRTTGL